MLFLDADIGFEPEQVLRLITCGADMCAAVYPVKRIDWERDEAKHRNRCGPIPPRPRCVMFSRLKIPSAVIERSGFLKVRYAGTGFLMIRRGALEAMCARHPELQYKRDHAADDGAAGDKRFALFESMIADDGTYLSEDFAFCKRWTDMGGEIWADLRSTLSHVGPMIVRGNLASQFAGAASAAA